MSFVFRKNLSIGSLDAETDTFLEECFVETEAYKVLSDFSASSPYFNKRVLVGRTGSGKTALLTQLYNTNKFKCEVVEAEKTIFEYISNNVFISKLAEKEVDLKIFYKALWTHVLLVKILEALDLGKSVDILDSLQNFFRRKKVDQSKVNSCLEYIKDFKDNFFSENFVVTLSEKLQTELSGSASVLNAISASGKISQEDIKTIQASTSHYISKEVLQHQNEIIQFLCNDDLLINPKYDKIIVTIDDLDRAWLSDNSLRYHFIEALLDSFKSFLKIREVKIFISIRSDILQGVYRNNLNRQAEKDKSLFLAIEWTKDEIRSILDKRIGNLIKDQYVRSKEANLANIFYFDIGGLRADEYILQHTMLRPREAIEFINLCFADADGSTEIKANHVESAKEIYYSSRKRALVAEWTSYYVNAETYISALDAIFKDKFTHEGIFRNKQDQTIFESIITNGAKKDYQDQVLDDAIDGKYYKLIQAWFEMGLIGIYKEGGAHVYSSYEKPTIDIAECIKREFVVHPLFKDIL